MIRPRRRRLLLVVLAVGALALVLMAGFATALLHPLGARSAPTGSPAEDGVAPAPALAPVPGNPAEDDRPFAARFGHKLAELERHCAGSLHAHACAGGVCAVRWRSVGGVEFVFGALAKDPWQLLDGPASILGVPEDWLPHASEHRQLFGPFGYSQVVPLEGGDACVLVGDPSGPPLEAIDRATLAAAVERCRALRIPASR